MEKDAETKNKTFLFKLGIGLLITCIPFLIIPIIIPFTSLTTQIKAGIVAGSLILAEIIFWVGAVLVGKEMINKIKNYFNLIKSKVRKLIKNKKKEK